MDGNNANLLKRPLDNNEEAVEAKSMRFEESLSCEVDPTLVLMSAPLDDENDFVKMKMSKAMFTEYGENAVNRKTQTLMSSILTDISSTNKQSKSKKPENSKSNGNPVIWPRSSNLERLYCDECNYQCRYVSVLMNHKKTHLKDGHVCKICGYTAKHINTLKIHELVHIDKNPFPCEQCNFRGKTLNDLKKHRSAHPNQKVFACSECEYTSTQSVTLEQHKVIHDSEKRHFCDHCGVVMKNADELSEHVKIFHSSEVK